MIEEYHCENEQSEPKQDEVGNNEIRNNEDRKNEDKHNEDRHNKGRHNEAGKNGQKRTLLCLGDSITQGMTAKSPSSTYPVQLARMMGMNMINQGVGGHVFDEKSIDEEMDINPDVITVAYGINDWFQYDSVDYFKEMCHNFFNKLTIVYPKAKIFVITPVWCSSEEEIKAMGYLFEIRKQIEQIACNFKTVYVIDGLKMVPNMPEYFVDGVHPNELGFMHYSMNLLREIVKYI